MMNRRWSIFGLVLNILAIFVAAWLVMMGLGWVRVQATAQLRRSASASLTSDSSSGCSSSGVSVNAPSVREHAGAYTRRPWQQVVRPAGRHWIDPIRP